MPSSVIRLLIYACCTFLFLVPPASYGQASTETKEIYLRILEVEKRNNDSVYASIGGGYNIGVQLGATGSIITQNDLTSNRRLVEIGFASIIRVTDSFAVLLIRPVAEAATNSLYETRKGDYIKLNIEVPKLTYHSVFFDMALANVELTNIDGQPLYAFDYLLKNDSKRLEDSILSSCTADIQDTYNRVKNRTDSTFDVYKLPLKEGRYKGRSVFNVLASCTNKDVFTFINYAKNRKNSYLGNTVQVVVKFANWIFDNAPFSSKEVYDTIIAYKSKPLLLKQFVQKNREELVREEFVREWIIEAIDATTKEDDERYNSMMEVAKLALPYLLDNYSNGLYFYSEANHYKYKDNYTKSISASDSAIKYFDRVGMVNLSVSSYYYQGDNYRWLSKPDEAIKSYEKGFAWMQKNDTLLSKQQVQGLSASYYKGLGLSWLDKEDYKKAIENYLKAIEMLKAIGDYDNINSAIAIQKSLAKIYKKQGELTKAYQIYSEQLTLYRKLNDSKNEADVLDNIGSVQFSLGNYRTSINNYSTARDIYLGFRNFYNAGYSQSNIGQAYWNLGKYDSAIGAHNIALGYRRTDGSDAGQAYSWQKLGGLYKLTGEKSKALVAYDSAAVHYKLAKDNSGLKDLLNDVGDVYFNDKQYQKAFALYSEVHDINVKAKVKADLVSSFYQLANASFYFNNDTSKKYFTNCYTLAKEIGDKTNELYAGINLGYLCFKEYDYTKGENYFNASLTVAKSEKNKSQEANCYRLIAGANSGKLDFDKALLYFQKAIVIYDSLGEKSLLPELYRSIGNTLYTKGDFNEAKKWFEKSIQFATSINSRAEAGYSYNAIVFLHTIQGELTKAEAATDSAYNIFKDLNNSWQMADTYFNKATVAEARSSNVTAFRYYSMADSIYIKEKDNFSHSTCQTNLGCIFYYQADFDNALKYFKVTDSILSTINNVTEAHLLAPTNIGAAYYYKKDYAKAEQYLLDGYKKSTAKKVNRIINISSNFLGMTYYETKKYQEAEKYLLESYKLSQQMNESDMVIQAGMSLGRLYVAQNNIEKGKDYLSRTVEYTKQIENTKYSWEILYEYGIFFYNQKNYDSATAYFKQAVQIVENASQNLFGGAEAKKLYNADARKVDLYNKLVASLAKSNKADDALYYANKTNTQAVKEQMEKAGLVTNDKEKSDALKKGSELLQKKSSVEQSILKEKSKPEKEQNKKLIASLETVKSVTEADYTNFIEGLQKQYPDLQAYFSNTNPKDFRNYIEDIPDSTIVALYVVNDNQLLIFTVTNKETAIKTIDLKQDINKQAAHFLGVLRNPKNATGTEGIKLRSTLNPIDDIRGDFKSEATDLYNLLITPIADQLKDKKNICVITNGKLGSIPFQCLGRNEEDNSFHFLIEDYGIFYTSKIDIFRKAYKNRPMESSLAVFGNPDKSLPGATDEAKSIGQIVPTATVYLEEQATEGKAKESLQKYNYVHFATHGVLDYVHFEDSYLLFASDNGKDDDGKLTIKEINGLTKQTNSMVILSACETAVSKEEVKGWYISPANAFLTNRVDAVVASLWKVPDETMNLLLSEFYKNIRTKSMTKVEALRHAQEVVSQNPKYNHPFFWSAFVLIGEWR